MFIINIVLALCTGMTHYALLEYYVSLPLVYVPVAAYSSYDIIYA